MLGTGYKAEMMGGKYPVSTLRGDDCLTRRSQSPKNLPTFTHCFSVINFDVQNKKYSRGIHLSCTTANLTSDPFEQIRSRNIIRTENCTCCICVVKLRKLGTCCEETGIGRSSGIAPACVNKGPVYTVDKLTIGPALLELQKLYFSRIEK